MQLIIAEKPSLGRNIAAAIGPIIKPPMVMITSFGSYFRKRTMGIRTVATSTNAIALIIAMMTSLFVRLFLSTKITLQKKITPRKTLPFKVQT